MGSIETENIGCKKSPTAKKVGRKGIHMNIQSKMRKRNPIKSKIRSKEIKLRNVNEQTNWEESSHANSIHNTAYLPNETGMTKRLNPYRMSG